MKRRQIIELIVQYHYLFPRLLTKRGSKGTKRNPKNSTKGNKQKPKLPQLTQIPDYSTNSAAPTNTQLPQLTQKHLESLAKYNPSALQDIPQDFVQQLNLPK